MFPFFFPHFLFLRASRAKSFLCGSLSFLIWKMGQLQNMVQLHLNSTLFIFCALFESWNHIPLTILTFDTLVCISEEQG